MTTEIVLRAPMSSDGDPEWPGATWVGILDLAHLPDVRPRDEAVCVAPASDGYRNARVLIRDGLTPLQFVDAAIDGGRVRVPLPLTAPDTAPEVALPPMSVVLCTRERPDDLRGSLASLLTVDYPDFEIIVVDNAPTTDATARVVAEVGDDRVRRIVEPVAGLASARNAGLRAATHDIVAFTDDDVVADPAWLRGLALGFSRSDDIACVCGLVPSGELRTMPQAYFDWRVSWADNIESRVYSMAQPPEDVPLFPFQVGVYGTGANFAVRRQAIVDLGGFDERLGAGTRTRGGEDLDIFFRVLTAGHGLATEPSSIIWHRHRSDNAALMSQARGYGVGLGAWLTKVAVTREYRRLALSVLRRRGRAVARAGAAYGAIAAPPPAFLQSVPKSVGRVEVFSVIAGPYALWREGRALARGTRQSTSGTTPSQPGRQQDTGK
ncbi:glycosyltransferase [Gordonia sp. CPCC 205515]|uniref:glycosyltransferase family 2 protein n=1 Tax=Gordonia sp. CPCC 205515 TaxID=3140791 RepID=UPI003AF3D1E4